MKYKSALISALTIAFAILILVTGGIIFLMVKRSMQPLENLATTAMVISTGEQLDTPIKVNSTDEVGRMAKSLDRLRTSLKAAMERLGE